MIDYDLVIVGAGSGNMLPVDDIKGMRVAIVERAKFGGTCLNRGCIPSKMLTYAADVAETVRTAERYGVRADLEGADWPSIRDRVFARLDQSSTDGMEHRRRSGVDVYVDDARFIAPKVLAVGREQLRADRMILAAGARPTIPQIPGLAGVPFHTTDTIMRIDALPASMIVLGGGAVAAELGHVFGAFGTDVTIVERDPRLLAMLDDDIAQRFTECSERRFELRLDTTAARVEERTNGVAMHLEGGTRPGVIEAETILVAVGRTANSDELGVASAGIDVDDDGRVITDDYGATNVSGVWAIGDVTNRLQAKHLANAQMRAVVQNAFHPDRPKRAHFPV